MVGVLRTRLVSLYPGYCVDEALSHTCFSLARSMRAPGVDHRLVVTQGPEHVVREPWVRPAVGAWTARAAYRAGLEPALKRWTESCFLRALAPGDVAYLWPDVGLDTLRRVKDRGYPMVLERINCHRAVSRRILDEAYGALGLPPDHGLRPDLEERERTELALADFVFCPSPLVAASMVEEGVPPRKILRGAYGWDPSRVGTPDPPAPRRRGDRLRALFVGRGCVRKGLHVLLRAWAAAGVRGRLVLKGRIDEALARMFAGALARGDVVVEPHSRGVRAAYEAADVFVLPTLEEGSPLVVYEAMASGLPVVTTPMGAGDVVRDGVEGRVLAPHDADGIAAALRAYAADEDARHAAAVRAWHRARAFTWRAVGARRLETLLAALRGEPRSAIETWPAAREASHAASRITEAGEVVARP